jgi:hypothetical protein
VVLRCARVVQAGNVQGTATPAASARGHNRAKETAMGGQRDDDRTDPGRHREAGTPAEPKPSARPTWGEQTPDLDRQRGEGGGGTSSDSDGQRMDDQ